MTTTHACGLLVVALLIATGCAPEDDAEGPLGEAASALLTENALSPNALSPNALSPNALSSLLAPGADGDLARMLLRYVVGCALGPGQSFALSFQDAGGQHNEVYKGLLGLAPAWASGPLDQAGQQMVSACLAARTNWYSITVMISVRSAEAPLHGTTSAVERLLYPATEGAFWGNLFASTPYLRACYQVEHAAHSRALLRDCAAGHLEQNGSVSACGMISLLGDCDLLCAKLDAEGATPECHDPTHGPTPYVLTTALP